MGELGELSLCFFLYVCKFFTEITRIRCVLQAWPWHSCNPRTVVNTGWSHSDGAGVKCPILVLLCPMSKCLKQSQMSQKQLEQP